MQETPILSLGQVMQIERHQLKKMMPALQREIFSSCRRGPLHRPPSLIQPSLVTVQRGAQTVRGSPVKKRSRLIVFRLFGCLQAPLCCNRKLIPSLLLVLLLAPYAAKGSEPHRCRAARLRTI